MPKRETDWTTFATEHEAHEWLQECTRSGNPDHVRHVCPIAELPDPVARRAAEARGHEWAMVWTYTPEHLRSARGLTF